MRWPLKKEARVVGIDDGPYVRNSDRTVIIATLYRLDGHIDGIKEGVVVTDGDDSARKVSELMETSGFKEQARAILSDGACLAGFNVLDMDLLHTMTGIPVVTVSDERPDDTSVKEALRHLPDAERRWGLIEAHPPNPVELPDGICYARSVGVPHDMLEGLIRSVTRNGRTPEPVRISHMIARCVHDGIRRRCS